MGCGSSKVNNIETQAIIKSADKDKVISAPQINNFFDQPEQSSSKPVHNEDAPAASLKNKHSVLKLAKKGSLTELNDLNLSSSDVNERGMWDSTPLIYACQYNHTKTAILLIQKGADVDLFNERRVSPLLLACMEGMAEVVEVILKKSTRTIDMEGTAYNSKIDVNAALTPLLAATTNGHEQIVKLLLQCNAKVDKGVESLSTSSSTHPVLAAAKFGHVQVLQLLINAGADINIHDQHSNSVLHLACDKSHDHVACFLIQRMNERIWNSINKQGYHFLHLAAKNGLISIFEQINTSKLNIDLDVIDSQRRTPLYFACKRRKRDVVVNLLASGSDWKMCDKNGLSCKNIIENDSNLSDIFDEFPELSCDKSNTEKVDENSNAKPVIVNAAAANRATLINNPVRLNISKLPPITNTTILTPNTLTQETN